MTAAVPLTKPDGTVHAYACGNCGFLHCGWSHGGGWNERDVEMTRAEAERCCVCEKCSRIIGTDNLFARECDACRAASAAEMKARAVAQRNTDCESWESAVANHDDAWRFTLASGRTGSLYVGDDYAGVFSSGWARLDPTPDDPDPHVASDTLQRSVEFAAMGALASLSAHYDDHVQTLTKVTP